MNLKAKDILELYKSGSYGTPDSPIRSSSVKSAFWFGYLDARGAQAYRGRVNHEAARAGEMARREDEEKLDAAPYSKASGI